MKILDAEIACEVIRPRLSETHKGDYGRVLVVGGSEPYGGAAILAASASVYSGAGLTFVACAAENHAALTARLPEAIYVDAKTASFEENLTRADVVLIGPGLGLGSGGLLEKVLRGLSAEQTVILDGDAITLWAKKATKTQARLIFTPHQMELERLSGLAIGSQTDAALQAFVEKVGAIIVAKGPETRIARPGWEMEKVIQGVPAQATGGMGDTLAGMIAGFVAQFHSDQAVSAAVWLHAEIAGKLAESQYVVLPTAIISQIPFEMHNVIK
ncbi:MAG: NAD(P)H-hydrate dehydratase [Streptococcaceae bacterium]|jgi:hydroxyethylthiazole kinase-like uncharacterized protein yjeF|nr:NAD(P)H-hydrate dehydratase [Streptococcaceae bacterium]